MIKVGLLGDSIRQIGYGPLVGKYLGENYVVFQNGDNDRFARYTLRVLFDAREELASCDIIHFNCGLWDVSDLFGDGIFTNPSEYQETIFRIAKLLKRITPNVIFATTTPVREGNPYDQNSTIERYNALVVPGLKKMGVAINDLHALIAQDIPGNIRETDLLHLTPKGAELAAEAVAQAILSFDLAAGKGSAKASLPSKNGAPI
jgi:lysophospholipase L1-like esterase